MLPLIQHLQLALATVTRAVSRNWGHATREDMNREQQERVEERTANKGALRRFHIQITRGESQDAGRGV